MAHDTLQDTELARALRNLITDLSELVQKEVRLARAEVAYHLGLGLQAGIWFAAAALLALVTCLLIVEGVVLALARAGLAIHWACFLVAAIVAAMAALAVFSGRAVGAGKIARTRTARQLRETIKTAEEQIQ